MLRSLPLIFLISVCSQNEALRPGFPGMKYIGSFNSTVDGKSTEFYVSYNYGTWTQADQDCRSLYSGEGRLLAIEIPAKRGVLMTLMEAYGFPHTYWTSGLYNSASGAWVWSSPTLGNNVPLQNWAPWDPAFSPPPTGTHLRLALNHRQPNDGKWSALANTQRLRYICEVQPTEPVPCFETNDLVIVLDSSGSIGTGNYETAKRFVASLVSAFTLHPTSEVSLIIYSRGVEIVIPLRSGLSYDDIQAKILSATYMNSGTPTHLGIDAAISQFLSNSRAMPRNMVVLTDGQSDSPTQTADSANRAKANNIRSFAVGITNNVIDAELLTIAGGNPDRVYKAETFINLIKLLSPLSIQICY